MLSLNMSINYIWFCYIHLSIFHIVKNFLIIINSWMVFHHIIIPYFFFCLSPQLLAIYIVYNFLLLQIMLQPIFLAHLIFP